MAFTSGVFWALLSTWIYLSANRCYTCSVRVRFIIVFSNERYRQAFRAFQTRSGKKLNCLYVTAILENLREHIYIRICVISSYLRDTNAVKTERADVRRDHVSAHQRYTFVCNIPRCVARRKEKKNPPETKVNSTIPELCMVMQIKVQGINMVGRKPAETIHHSSLCTSSVLKIRPRFRASSSIVCDSPPPVQKV